MHVKTSRSKCLGQKISCGTCVHPIGLLCCSTVFCSFLTSSVNGSGRDWLDRLMFRLIADEIVCMASYIDPPIPRRDHRPCSTDADYIDLTTQTARSVICIPPVYGSHPITCPQCSFRRGTKIVGYFVFQSRRYYAGKNCGGKMIKMTRREITKEAT